MTKVFLSYARSDDGEPYDPSTSFVHRLHADLTRAGLDVWFDRMSLPSRQLTFHQEIADAIRTCDRLVLVVGPKTSLSDYVRQEWRWALELDKHVVPILRRGDYPHVPSELALLHCDDFRDDTHYQTQLTKLIDNLRRPEPPLGGLFGVPSLPPHFLGRPDLLRRVKDALLVDLQKPVVITGTASRVGMQGMGGIGKSVLAATLARDREIRRSYPDGIIWIGVGQQPDRVRLQRDVVRHLGGQEFFETEVQGLGVLRQLLAQRAVLLVIDDVWNARDAQAFDVLGPRCRALVTTRDAGILHTLGGESVPVSLFTVTEALQLLADAVEVERAALPAEAHEVVKECGCLPLAVALCGGMARKRGGEWGAILQRLRRADLEKIADREAINEQHQSIWRAMQVSIDVLPPEEQQRFAELAVFATDRTVPEAAVRTLWSHTGHLDELDTTDLIINLAERSLIQLDQKASQPGEAVERQFRLHDLLYDFATRLAGEPKALHQTLLDAYRTQSPGGWHTGPNDGFLFQCLISHMIASEKWEEAEKTLSDLQFIAAKIKTGMTFDLIGDYRLALDSLPEAQEEKREMATREARVQRYIHDLIAYAKGEIKSLEIIPSTEPWSNERIEQECRRIRENPTRCDRLAAFSGFVTSGCYPLVNFGARPGFVIQHAYNRLPGDPVRKAAEGIIGTLAVPLLLRRWPKNATWNPKPALLRTFEGHRSAVTCVSITPDGQRAISGAWDKTLRVWDLGSGQCLRTLEGHGKFVRGVSVTPDGRRAVSGSDDNTLRVWDLESGQCLRTLNGHSNRVWSVSVTPDGRRAISGSDDNTLRVWDLESGKCLRTLEGHSNRVLSVSVSADGRRAVSGSDDNSLLVWDLESGQCLRALEGHSNKAMCVSVTLDGQRAVSGSDDNTLRVWDLESGRSLRTLEGHSNRVLSVSVTPDGRRLVSGSGDKTLRVWDLESGQCLRTLEGHSKRVWSVSVTPDGRRAVSGSDDNTLRVWDLEGGQFLRTLEGHFDWATSVGITPDGHRTVSGSNDTTLRVWDMEDGQCLLTLQGHRDVVTSLSVTPDGCRVVAGSGDNTLRVWDLESGECLRTLEGHRAGVESLSITPDGRRIVSGSKDKTLRVWDLESGQCLRTLEGHSDVVESLSVTPDGRRIVSGSWDTTLRVWDLESGRCLHILKGHSNSVDCVGITTDGRQAISGSVDNTLRVWDLESGQCLLTLEGHNSRVKSLSITPDGRRIVSGSKDKTLQVWDLESGQCLRTLKGHSDKTTNVCITPDGGRVVTGSHDMTLRVWDLESGVCLGLYAAPATMLAFALADHGNTICAGTASGDVHIIDVRGIAPGLDLTSNHRGVASE